MCVCVRVIERKHLLLLQALEKHLNLAQHERAKTNLIVQTGSAESNIDRVRRRVMMWTEGGLLVRPVADDKVHDCFRWLCVCFPPFRRDIRVIVVVVVERRQRQQRMERIKITMQQRQRAWAKQDCK